ncbi:hypothetical protein BD410DRAFT_791159 [Rickenella mellea]|uniref:Microtubule associated protein n=1 Tax=Rickenella mellea TaxID=50990 RepID=A0A4Y7PY77_9AGAM|nr:hypothetical protein BD410DRAFT_791159 [Rickenella mellea]
MMDNPLTISSLLDSLHKHLQQQTQLLPTLHAQLGLPDSALTRELSELQDLLENCVERQIEGRRKEVESWMEKCEEVEKDCLRLGRALGTHAKVVGASVGELRKQRALPVRHSMLKEHQDKLEQLYKTKLEQLTHLTNRISALARTLGTDFYTSDILEHTPCQGENAGDSSALRDVTTERFSKLEKELVRGKSEITRRLTQLAATMMQMDWLYGELEIEPPAGEDSDLPNILSNSASPSDPFLSSSISSSGFSTPTPGSRSVSSAARTTSLFAKHSPHEELASYHRVFALFVARIEEAEASGVSLEPGSLVGVEGVEPTPGLLAWAASTLATLEETKKKREAAIQAMYDQLEALWRRLGVPQESMDGFVDHNRGSTEETVRAYEQELERMMELKRERMSVFVCSAREEIEVLWDELMVGEEERRDFAPFADDEHTEELLSIHESEIRRLKDERRIKAPLLASIRRYFDICEEEKELAAAASDQSRLLGKGPRDPGRLLREEKMRKRVNKEKPRLENDLLNSIPSWEEQHGMPFLVNGARIVDVLMETMVATDKENARRNKPRAGSVPPRATTPSFGNDHHGNNNSNGGRSGTVTPAVRPGSSMGMTHSQSVPNKRQRVGLASASSTNTRTPFGNAHANGNTNALPGSQIHKPPGTASKTPGSSLPRPSASKPAHAPMPARMGYGPAGIGMGYATTMREQKQNRITSTSSMISTHSSTFEVGGGRQVSGNPLRASRNRRESFKPRPSMDGVALWSGGEGHGGYARRGAFAGGTALEEEDEF